jgi:hypothetical protein
VQERHHHAVGRPGAARQGLLQHHRPGLVGRGKVKRVDVSVDGGRNWRTARLESPVMSKCLTRFNIDWVWDGKPALVQSRAMDDTGYVQPTYKQLRAVRGTRSIYHNNASRPGWCRRAGRSRMSSSRDLTAALLLAAAAGAASAQATAYPASVAQRHAEGSGGWDIDVRPDFKGLPAGSGSRGQGHGRVGSEVRVLPRRVRREQRGVQPARGRHHQGRHPDRPRRPPARPQLPGRTTLMKVSQVSTLWDYIRRAMPWTQPKSLSTEEVYAVTAYLLNWAAWCRTTSRCPTATSPTCSSACPTATA